MSAYSIALFLHIVAVLGVVVELSLQWTGLWQIRSAVRPEQVRTWMGILKSASRVGMASWLTISVSGLYMLLTVWGGVAWIIVTLVSVVLVTVLAFAVAGPRLAAIERAAATEKGLPSDTFRNLANHPLLWFSIQTQVAIALAIIFLKIAKPDLVGSLLTIGVAIVLGLASTLRVPRRERAQAGSAD